MNISNLSASAQNLNDTMKALDLVGRLALAADLGGRVVFTTSLSIEDQVITHAIGTEKLTIDVATLETGRLFAETVALIAETENRYGMTISRFFPVREDVETYVARYGMNGFYDSVEARHACCAVRKVRPLARALEGARIWVTGLRRGQSGNRADTPFAEFDGERGLIKVNPLADWDITRIRAYAASKAIPVNPLHDRGYPSIGCEPCTRAIKPGEPERAGRWWWENDEKRECGLHVPDAALPSLESSSL